MDAFERAERQMMAAYFLDYHRPGVSRVIGLKLLKEEYGVELDPKIHYAVFANLKKQDWIYGFSDGRAQLTATGYKPVREAVLRFINGTAIEVDWDKGEVLTDGKLPDDFPLPKRWKWMQWDNPAPTTSSAVLGGNVSGIRLGGNVTASDVTTTHVVPLPPHYPPKKQGINWTKWGTIIGGLGLLATIILGLLALS